jgi:hypothetical protein
MTINITPVGVIESTLMYGIVHAIWIVIKWFGKRLEKEVRQERNQIIKTHVKTGHEGRLKHCVDEACISLRRPVQSPVPPQVVDTEL